VVLKEKEIREFTYEVTTDSLESAIELANMGAAKVIKNEYWDTEDVTLIEAYDVSQEEIPF
jgi:hypothetical protein